MIRLTVATIADVIEVPQVETQDHVTSVFIDLDSTQVVETIPNPKPTSRLYRTWSTVRRALLRAVQAVRTARDAAAWVTSGVPALAARAGSLPHRYRYAGRHRTAANAYGRTRSTAEFTTALRAARQSASDSQEGELPDLDVAFITWIERYLQTLRADNLVLHPSGRHFTC